MGFLQPLNVYFLLLRSFLRSHREHRVNFLAGTLSNIVSSFLSILFVVLLVDGKVVPNIMGWTRSEILFVYGYSMLPLGLFGILSQNLSSFANCYVTDGELDRIIVRPLNTWCQIVFENFNLQSLGTMFAGLILMALSAGNSGAYLSPSMFVWITFSTLLGTILLLSVFTIASSLSFFIEGRIGFFYLFYNLLNFARYPTPIFGPLLGFILQFGLPYAFVAFIPATLVLGKDAWRLHVIAMPFVTLAVAVLASIVWQQGIRNYRSPGN